MKIKDALRLALNRSEEWATDSQGIEVLEGIKKFVDRIDKADPKDLFSEQDAAQLAEFICFVRQRGALRKVQ